VSSRGICRCRARRRRGSSRALTRWEVFMFDIVAFRRCSMKFSPYLILSQEGTKLHA
jgi:hypothetical protein